MAIPTDRPPFVRPPDFKVKYEASCFCGTIRYDLAADCLDSMYCHCETCQTLHGTPFQWAAVVRKEDVSFREGVAEKLVPYQSSSRANDYGLPCKLGCPDCHAPVMDEGRNMVLILPPYIHFPHEETADGSEGRKIVPEAWRAKHHMFYGSRCADMKDGLEKFLGRKGHGLCDDEGRPISEASSK